MFKRGINKIKRNSFYFKRRWKWYIYFYPHDIFSCPESDYQCKLLITTNQHNDDYIFGNVFLKKFYTLFDLNDTSKIKIYGKKNIAKIKLIDDKDMFVDPMEKKRFDNKEKNLVQSQQQF